MKKPITLSAVVHKLVSPEPELDREIAERVGQEILRDELEPGAWATALAMSGGKKQDALASYARIRIRKLAGERRVRQAKSRSFEARRLNTCLGIKTVQDLLDRSNSGGRLNLLCPKVSVIWLLILMLGCTGTLACLARLAEPWTPDRFEKWILLAAPIIGLASGLTAIIARSTLPKAWVMPRWNTGVAMAGSLACFASLYLGTKVISRVPPAVIEQLTHPSAAAKAAPAKLKAEPAEAPSTAVLVKPKPGALAAASTAAVGEQ